MTDVYRLSWRYDILVFTIVIRLLLFDSKKTMGHFNPLKALHLYSRRKPNAEQVH